MKKPVKGEVQKKTVQNFADYLKRTIFAPTNSVAEIAQLVEHDLAKVGVASSSLVFRSFFLPLGKRGSKQPRDVKRSFADRKSVAQYVGVIERLAASHEKY